MTAFPLGVLLPVGCSVNNVKDQSLNCATNPVIVSLASP